MSATLSIINKVIMIGEINHPPRWRCTEGNAVLCLTTRQGAHSEIHAVRLTGHQQEPELKVGLLVYLEGKIRTTDFVDE